MFDNRQNSLGGGCFPRKKLVHTYDDIISVENLLGAWQEFLKGKRHKKDVQEFQFRLMTNVLALHIELRNKTYRHGDYQHFRISDPKPRDIHKATVRDRVLHHALYRVLYPFFDQIFITDSYSCRLRKGTHKAMERFKSFAYTVSKNHTKTVWVLKCDIKKFFASIDRGILLEILSQRIKDTDILWLLKNVIQSFKTQPGKGLPLGNLTSQLFVNIYMNEFDQFVKHTLKTRYYIRYADDFVVLSDDKDRLLKIMRYIVRFLQEKLQLTLHPDKVSIRTISSGVDFLGWVHFSDHRVLRTATKRKMLRNLNLKNLSSYRGLLKHGNTIKLQKQINSATAI